MSPEIYPTQWWMWCQRMQERHHPHQETGAWSCNHPAQGSKICIDTSTACCYSSMQEQKAANHDKTKDAFPSNLIYKCRMLSRTYRRCDPWQRLCILQCETTWGNGTLCPGTDVITLSMHWNSMERDSNHHSSSSDFFIYTNILNESEKENTLASKTVSIMCIILCCAYATYIDKTLTHTFHMCIHQLCFLWESNCGTAFPQHRSLALIKER